MSRQSILYPVTDRSGRPNAERTADKWAMRLMALLILVGIGSSIQAQQGQFSEEDFSAWIDGQGVEKAIADYRSWQKGHPDAAPIKRETVNRIGWKMAERGEIAAAIKLFEFNLSLYPGHYDPWDSYAEAVLMRGGENYIDTAIRCFAKSLELNPENANAAQRLLVLKNYSKHEFMIPMIDGIRLFTQIYIPRDGSKKYPILYQREWYGNDNYGPEYRRVLHRNESLVKEGFIFVFQDIRGRFMSEGEFKVLRPLKKSGAPERSIDESTDAFDTIEWLLKNIQGHNGRVGLRGGSYSGWAALMAAIRPHPAVKAAVVAASPADWWHGDDLHHNGAFRLMYAYSWVGHDAWPRESGPTLKPTPWPGYNTQDGYQFFLDLGPVKNVNRRYFKGENPTWNDYMRHGDYDEFWRELNILPHLRHLKVPVLNVIGWFDAEDFRGPLLIYQAIEKNSPGLFNSVVIGPWRHGGWHNSSGESLGDISFGSKTSEFFQREIEYPFFMHFLKQTGELDIPEASVFQTGANLWRKMDCWPPRGTREKKLFLGEKGTLTFESPDRDEGLPCDEFLSDPSKPVPWSMAVQTQQGSTWMVADQRFAASRPDVLVYRTEPLKEDIAIAGPITAQLCVSTTGTDADWIVKLIDVYPDDAGRTLAGYQMLLAGDVCRSKYRNHPEKPQAMVPSQITEVAFDLYDKFHTFKKGHRIMIQVQSTWFPVIDRNPQAFCNIYEAEETDFQKAYHRVFRSKSHPSCVKLNVLAE